MLIFGTPSIFKTNPSYELQAYGQDGERYLPDKEGSFFKTGSLSDTGEKVCI